MEAAHGAAYSQDLRDRVIDAALAGTPARQVAGRFGVGDATAIVWVRRARQAVNGPRASRDSRGAASLIRIAITSRLDHGDPGPDDQ